MFLPVIATIDRALMLDAVRLEILASPSVVSASRLHCREDIVSTSRRMHPSSGMDQRA